ncbi:hypothetical protein AB0L09_27050 [Streptomyces zaomyceticus]
MSARPSAVGTHGSVRDRSTSGRTVLPMEYGPVGAGSSARATTGASPGAPSVVAAVVGADRHVGAKNGDDGARSTGDGFVAFGAEVVSGPAEAVAGTAVARAVGNTREQARRAAEAALLNRIMRER